MSNLLNPMHFAAWLKERAEKHDGYIMCAVGQDPKKLNEWYFDQYKKESSKRYAKALEWRETAERVWDCQGLADGYVTEMTGVKTDIKARHNYSTWCGIRGAGDIPAERRVPGAAVFMDGDYIHHVGFLVEPVIPAKPEGDWIVVEAMGLMYGVVYTKLSERDWNKWGWMTEKFDYSHCETMEPEDDGLLKRGMYNNAAVKDLQMALIALGYSCGKWGADGDFGEMTESALKAFQRDHSLTEGGIADEKTLAMIDELLVEDGDMPETVEPVKGILISAGSAWNIRTQPSLKGAVMGYAKRGDLYAGSGATAEGWVGILFNGEPAWVSEKALA